MLALVGQHRGDVEVDAANAVWPDDLRQRVAVMADSVLEIGPIIVEHLAAQPDHPVVGVERELGVVDAVGAVIIAAGEIVDAVFDVLDRPAADARQRGRQDADLVGEQLATEAAAGDHRDEVDLVRRHAQRQRHGPADIVVHRAVHVDGELARAALVLGDGADGFERLRARTRPAQPAPDDPGGAGKICLHRPEREPPLHRDVGGAALGMQHAIAGGLHRLLRVGHHRQVFVLDRDQVERVLGHVAALGHHHGDRFADVADAADGDAALLDRRIGEARQRPRRPGDVGAGQHLDHALERRCGADVDRLDAGVRARAAQHRRVQHVGQVDVVDVAALPGEQARILDALDALADPLQRLARLLALAARRDRRALDGRAHHAASAIACWSSAARSTAAMMF